MEKFNIDIILPNYNKSNYLEEALNSVLDQTFKNWHRPFVFVNIKTFLSLYSSCVAILAAIIVLPVPANPFTIIFLLLNTDKRKDC